MSNRRTLILIIASLFLSFALTVIPLPEVLVRYRPDFVAMTLFFWLVSVPNWIGIGFAFICGLLLDTLHGSLLGQHALAMVVISYITLKLHLRIRVFTIWQELIAIALLLGIYHFLLFWSASIGNQGLNYGWSHATQLVASVVFWPAWVVFLNTIASRPR